MIKIVFINPSADKYSDIKIWTSDLMNEIRGVRVAVMPKMVPMILAALTPSEFSFTFCDEEIEDVNFEELDADIVALTGMTVQADRAYVIADVCREKGVTVVMGGIHATVMPEEALLHCDSVAVGEGENTWPVMLEDYKNGCLKRIYDAKDYPPVTELVSPKIDIIKFKHYSVLPLMATKGCPFDCDFCSVSFVNGSRIRLKPVERVLEEIREYEKYNKGLFKMTYQFVDDNLYVNREYTKKLFTALKEAKINWHGQGTLNTAKDEEILKLMAESGCRIFSIGFESISDESLKEANKSKANQVAVYESAVNNIMKYGMIPGGFFIFGFDSDDKDIFRDTVQFIMEKHIVNSTFCILTPFPGTALCKRVEDRVFDKRWSNYGVVNCVFEPKKMSPEELENGSYWASRELAKIDSMKRQLEYFWNQGPWKTNPALRLRERAALVLIGLSFRKKNKELSGFAFWAAFHKKAVDFFIILTAMVFNDMTSKYFAESNMDFPEIEGDGEGEDSETTASIA